MIAPKGRQLSSYVKDSVKIINCSRARQFLIQSRKKNNLNPVNLAEKLTINNDNNNYRVLPFSCSFSSVISAGNPAIPGWTHAAMMAVCLKNKTLKHNCIKAQVITCNSQFAVKFIPKPEELQLPEKVFTSFAIRRKAGYRRLHYDEACLPSAMFSRHSPAENEKRPKNFHQSEAPKKFPYFNAGWSIWNACVLVVSSLSDVAFGQKILMWSFRWLHRTLIF